MIAALATRGGRRVALEGAIRDAIRSGRLQPSDPLPSSRSLAADLGIARGTVAEAYAQLTAEGYLTARPGAPTARRRRRRRRHVRHRRQTPADRPAFTLEVGVPDVAAFPRAAWMAAMRRALRTAPAPLLALGDPRGTAALREALASHLRRTRGVVADPARILVTCGYSHALAVLCRALRATGHEEIAMEDPCLHQHRTIAAGTGLRVRALPVDDDGASASPPAGTRAAIVTPAHQFPLGMTLAPARRNALIAWAAPTTR